MRTEVAHPQVAVGEPFDGILLDLDGCVYAGARPIPGAAEVLRGLAAAGVPYGFLTNNASRTAAEAAAHISSFGVDARAEQVMSSGMVAAQALAASVPAGARVLVVGAPALAGEIEAAGLVPVASAAEAPAAVVQGFAADTDWHALAEACVAVRAGAEWWATNLDPTLPTERGPMPANGAFVRIVAETTGQRPRVAGKPSAAMMAAGARMIGAQRPLMVGDRLDTDIAGAHAAGFPSGLVLTGVDTEEAARTAPADRRPDFVLDDLTALVPEHRGRLRRLG
ncbi:HAD-IIA family hydrolase [Brevibacterium album]|uniref:HAD-IIA family hydrolase n=1 Tax=Brevibacterium album TaxID=417948 RepID=UPI000400298F|nr:HAD-IIA family hydrolase [Brevibacterium album]